MAYAKEYVRRLEKENTQMKKSLSELKEYAEEQTKASYNKDTNRAHTFSIWTEVLNIINKGSEKG